MAKNRLTQELQALRASFEANGRSAADSARMDAIRSELSKTNRSARPIGGLRHTYISSGKRGFTPLGKKNR